MSAADWRPFGRYPKETRVTSVLPCVIYDIGFPTHGQALFGRIPGGSLSNQRSGNASSRIRRHSRGPPTWDGRCSRSLCTASSIDGISTPCAAGCERQECATAKSWYHENAWRHDGTIHSPFLITEVSIEKSAGSLALQRARDKGKPGESRGRKAPRLPHATSVH